MPDLPSAEILPDLAIRQDQVLQELDELNQRIEGVLKELTSKGGAAAAVVSGQTE